MEIINLINSMAPFLLLGFLLAGIMHAFIPASIYQRHFGQPTFKSVCYATLLAIPIPLCSCGVIPTAMSLRREGASKGSVISFLIATPQTGVDSILATYSMMGLPFTIVRPLAALVTALFGGQLANVFERKGVLQDKGAEHAPHSRAISEKSTTFFEKIKIALQYAYLDMMEDIGKWLAVGLVVAGLITVYVPDAFFQQFAGNSFLGIIMVLLFAIPMYLCATGSIPIAIALMLKGLTPGAALVLLMAGPAVNVASMLVIQRVMGTRTLLIYISSIVGGSVLFALGVDYLFPEGYFTASLVAKQSCSTSATVFQWICTGILALLLANAMLRRFFLTKRCSCHATEGQACSIAAPTTLLYIDGMKCHHCKANAEKAMNAVTGVQQVAVDLASGTASLSGNFDVEEVIASVEGIGFTVNRDKSRLRVSDISQRAIVIEGMHCNHCKANAEKIINTVEGVDDVNIDLASGTATLQGEFEMDEVVAAVESIGFKVKR